jgi:hypothetical protein
MRPLRFLPGASRGATLVSAVVALGILTMCLSGALRAYLEGSRAEVAQERRLAALGACQEQIERLRAGAGAVAERDFTVAGQGDIRGKLTVSGGPVAGTRQVSAVARWDGDELAPAGEVSLVTVLGGGGG